MKPTKIVSNDAGILAASNRLCTRDHEHITIQGAITRGSENYPWPFAVAIADVMMGTTTPSKDIPTAADDVLEVVGNVTYRLDQAGTIQTYARQQINLLYTRPLGKLGVAAGPARCRGRQRGVVQQFSEELRSHGHRHLGGRERVRHQPDLELVAPKVLSTQGASARDLRLGGRSAVDCVGLGLRVCLAVRRSW